MSDATISDDLRSALRRLAKAVVVITSRHGDERFAMAATAVSELSMDPPSLLICVNRTASIFEPLSEGANFAVNILHSSHQEISNACSGAMKGEARFELGNWANGPGDMPYLEDAQANFFCRNDKRVDYGTHAIFIGEVIGAQNSGDVDPLVYVDGCYTVVQPQG